MKNYIGDVLQSYLFKSRWLFGLIGLYAIALFLNAVGIHIWLPGCVISEMTGYQCLGCGLNRAAIALLEGEVAGAFELNPLIFVYLFVAVFWLISDYRKFIINHKNSTHEQV